MDPAHASRLYGQATWKLGLAIALSTFLLAFRNESSLVEMALLWTLVPWFSGLADLARAKGRSSWLALAGVLHVAGLVLLIVMPARSLTAPPRQELA